ncbi:MAG: electron transfer flavoprotein subunit beta/FixA family protein [Candidatus Bathyarchaeia archaeon]
MDVIVCVKQVPDTSNVRFDSKTGVMIRESLPVTINPFDLHAIEEAVRIKERYGARVKVISMGPPLAEASLRDALALGCDEAFLLTDPEFAGADTMATSYTLACAIRKIGRFSLIICGFKTTDGDTGHVGPALAQELDLPQITYVGKIIELDDRCIKAERVLEKGVEVIESRIPCLVTVLKGINQPRLATFKAKLMAKKAAVTIWGPKDIDADPSRIGLKGSPTHVANISMLPSPAKGEIFTGNTDQAVDKIVEKLQELRLI